VLSKVKADLCYGWGPEALVCQKYWKGAYVADSPQGSYSVLRRLFLSFGAGGMIALDYLYGRGFIFKYNSTEEVLVNGNIYGFSSVDIPLILWNPRFLIDLILK